MASTQADKRLERAEMHARPLQAEGQQADPGLEMRAVQGHALRSLLFECTAAIVAAIQEHGKR